MDRGDSMYYLWSFSLEIMRFEGKEENDPWFICSFHKLSWPPSGLWNWLCDTCWCKNLNRECWIAPLRSAVARETHVDVSSGARRVKVSWLLKLSLSLFPQATLGFFPPLYHQTSQADDWNLWHTFPHTSQLQPCIDRLSTWGNCLSVVTGVSSVPAPVDLSPVPSPLPPWGIWAQYPWCV